jgi:stearoyl-CoA desaturase (delta-9 desaturase)
MKSLFYPRNWFFVVMQIMAALVTLWAIANPEPIGYWLLSLFGYFLITCLGITVTFHRLLAHKSYKLSKPVEYLFSYFGNIGCTGSSVGWVFVHRTHHLHTDREGDPHSPVTLGPLGAFIGNYTAKFNKWTVKDIINDPVHRFMHEYYILVILGTIAILYLINPLLLIYLFFIPVFLNTMASRLSNWIDHTLIFGKRIYDTKDQSHNVWWWSWPTFGEGWHNNHHRYPGDYRIGRKWYEFDPGKYIINFLIITKLASSKN